MQGNRLTRRQLLLAAGSTPLALGTAPLLGAANDKGPADEPHPRTADEALERLKAGNRRFVEGKMRHGHEGKDWRKSLTKAQKPFATILSCSDSRVPTELLFDQGFGDLFVIRVAGNVIADDVLGSLQYAALHLQTPVLVVLGHDGCGGVTAALEAVDGTAKEPKFIAKLVNLIKPGLKDLDPKLRGTERLRAAVEANVRWSTGQLSRLPEGKHALDKGFKIVGAVYDLETGRLRLVE